MLNIERGRAGLVCSHTTAREDHVLKWGIENRHGFSCCRSVSGLWAVLVQFPRSLTCFKVRCSTHWVNLCWLCKELIKTFPSGLGVWKVVRLFQKSKEKPRIRLLNKWHISKKTKHLSFPLQSVSTFGNLPNLNLVLEIFTQVSIFNNLHLCSCNNFYIHWKKTKAFEIS